MFEVGEFIVQKGPFRSPQYRQKQTRDIRLVPQRGCRCEQRLEVESKYGFICWQLGEKAIM